MKKLLFSIASFFVFGFASAQNFIQKIETAKEQAIKFSNHFKKGNLPVFMATNPTGLLHLEFDTANTAYDTISRILYADYDDGIPTLNTNQTYKNGIFLNTQKYKGYTRIDSAIQLYEIDSLHIHDWDTAANAWMLSIRILFEYKSPGNISTITTYANFPIFGWMKLAVSKYYYDASDFNIAISNTAAKLVGLSFIMAPADSTAFTNDANGNPTTEILWTYADSVYVYDSKYLRIFDLNDNNTVETHQMWDTAGGTGVWKNNALDSLTYDVNGNATMDIQYSWNGSAWQDPVKYTTSYNSNNQITQQMRYVLNGAAWNASYRKTYTFKGNGDRDFDLVERSSDGTTWIVENGDPKDIYMYDITIGVNHQKGNTDVSIFPNPSDGKIILNLGNSVRGQSVSLTVFDITGKPVYNDMLFIKANTANVNLNNLDPGIYLLKLAHGSHISVKRIIIAK